MPEPIDEARTKLIDAVNSATDADELSTTVKNLKLFAEANQLLTPDPEPDPEPTGVKAWFNSHSESLIKVGGTLVTVGLIAALEARWDVIFRSKGSKLI